MNRRRRTANDHFHDPSRSPFSGGLLHAVDRVDLSADRPIVLEGDELTGGIAVSGSTSYATGARGLYALAGPHCW
jgi:hypothetical protein